MRKLAEGEVEIWAPVVWEREWTDELSGAPMKAGHYTGCLCGNTTAQLQVISPVRNPGPEGTPYWTHICERPWAVLTNRQRRAVAAWTRQAYLADTKVPISLFQSDDVDFLFRMRHGGTSLSLKAEDFGIRPDDPAGEGQSAGSGAVSRSDTGEGARAPEGAAAPLEAGPVLE